jgi:hypothetical protein
MKLLMPIAGSLLLATSLHAAEPTASDAETAISDAEPAVNTSSPRQEPAAVRAPAESTKPAAPADGPSRRGDTDRIELSTTQITGNAELPRVMYVVPWKRAELGDLAGKPAKSLLDEVLAPVDRDVFRRQNQYYEALKPDAAPKDP